MPEQFLMLQYQKLKKKKYRFSAHCLKLFQNTLTVNGAKIVQTN